MERKPQSSPPVIGLTGGICAGKTTVSARLAHHGAHVIDADSVGHQVLARDGEAYADVVAAFGPEILDETGEIVRKRLGAIVFADPEQLRRLNGISHPHMAERMRREIDALRQLAQPPPLIVLDAAILLEAGWDALCDLVWTVSVEPETALGRLQARNGLTREQAESRLAAQWPNARREARADRTIRNDGDLATLEAEVDRLWRDTVGDGDGSAGG